VRVAFVVGARPNYMKVAPILRELKRRSDGGDSTIEPLLVHTGQHYDEAMSDSFFRDLGMPQPDEFLGVGSDSHAKQTARVMIGFDDVCDRRELDAVVVVGDVNSTIGCALVAVKRGIKVVHVEAGLRSWDRTMPEEINRILTDQISDLLLITSEDAIANLEREGVAREKIVFVGNPMIDSLEDALSRMEVPSRNLGRYVVVTLHRPGNVDDDADLRAIIDGLAAIAERAPILFPVHPRTAKRFAEIGIELKQFDPGVALTTGIYSLPPLPYLEFLSLVRNAAMVMTDSGGIQEETTVMGVPCATLRPNTERPITIDVGTNELVARKAEAMIEAFDRVWRGEWKKGRRPDLWDGHAAPRIVDSLLALATEANAPP
jgi:UDP-N-acetylglucosamine 2-epimerase (non-hydrolysing)